MAIKKVVENPETGWSDWISPLMANYRLVCCDCGLAHDLEFKVFTARPDKAGWFTVTRDDLPNGRVRFRARRNNRATAQIRRKKPATS